MTDPKQATSTEAQDTRTPIDPSISFDDDDSPKNTTPASAAALLIDVVAAAVAITFTVLLLQDVLPLLK